MNLLVFKLCFLLGLGYGIKEDITEKYHKIKHCAIYENDEMCNALHEDAGILHRSKRFISMPAMRQQRHNVPCVK